MKKYALPGILNKREFVFFTLIVALAVLSARSQNKALFINEIMAVNNATIADEFNEYNDWIELYNASDEDIDLSGMYLSDNSGSLNKYRIDAPDSEGLIVPPKSHKIIWADGDSAQGTLHTNFKLSSSGEKVLLIDVDGKTVIDRISFGEQKGDVSWGRFPDGAEKVSLLTAPTPGGPNKPYAKEDVAPPVLSVPPGFYSGQVVVKITAPGDGSRIIYTTDGSDPGEDSGYVYVKPLVLTKTTVVRARTYDVYHDSSEIVTGTFLVDEETTFPVVSLTTNPPNLWDWNSGIYVKGPNAQEKLPYYGANFHKDWRKSGVIEFFIENGKVYLFNDITLKVSGGYSAAMPKKSFTVKTEPVNGKKYFPYRFFRDKNINCFKRLFLRSDSYGGFRIKNELIYELNKKAKSTVSIQAYLPVILYLNGKYWGIYNLMEAKDDEFIKNNYGHDSIDMFEDRFIMSGDTVEYQKFLDYLNSTDLTKNSEFETINRTIDVDNCIDYWFYEMYTGKWDNGNIRYWKPRGCPGAKWRWISYDMDIWADPENMGRLISDMTAHGPYILGPLLENPLFRRMFINRFCDHLNSTFNAESVKKTIDMIYGRVYPEMPRDITRWRKEFQDEEGITLSMDEWNQQVENLRKYADARPGGLRAKMKKCFLLSDEYSLTVINENPAGGTISINTVDAGALPLWRGRYFRDVPVPISACPAVGFSFAGWGRDDAIPVDKTHDTLCYIKDDLCIIPKFDNEVAKNLKNYFFPSAYSIRIDKNAVRIDLPFKSSVHLRIVDLLGKEVGSLSQYMNSGSFLVPMSTIAGRGRVTTGVFFLQLSAKNIFTTKKYTATKRMILGSR